MGTEIHIDFETRSTCDLVKAGAHVYAEDPNTGIWCMAYQIFVDTKPVSRKPHIWHSPCTLPVDFTEALNDPCVSIVAFNAQFEYLIWNNVFTQYGVRKLPISNFRCVQAQAAALGLPQSLKDCALACNVMKEKDQAGWRLMLSMAKPRRKKLSDNSDLFPQELGKLYWNDSRDNRERLGEYCIRDVEVEIALDNIIPKLQRREREIWLLDQRINNRGFEIDAPSVTKAVRAIESEMLDLNQKLSIITNGEVETSKQIARLKAWISREHGLDVDLDKASVRTQLQTSLPPQVAEVLRIRQQTSQSSVGKLRAMLTTTAEGTKRARGMFKYHGAANARWSGRQIQPQNMPGRRKLSYEQINDIFSSGFDKEYLRQTHGEVIEPIVSCLRAMIKAKEHHAFIGYDFKAIESIALAWITGDEPILIEYEKGNDLYIIIAEQIFMKRVRKGDPERAAGKCAELALGYGGGVNAFENMGRLFNVDFTAVQNAVAQTMTQEESTSSHWIAKTYTKNGGALTNSQAQAIEIVKQRWRASRPCVTNFWETLESAANSAILNPHKIFRCGRKELIQIAMYGDTMKIILPSGKAMAYPNARLERTKKGTTIVYKSSEIRSWDKAETYGGKLWRERLLCNSQRHTCRSHAQAEQRRHGNRPPCS